MQGVTVAGRWLFAVALAVSALVVSGSAQAQGAGYFEVLPPAGTSLDPALAARWAKGLPAKAPDAAREAVFCRDAVSCREWESLKSRAGRGDVAAMRSMGFRLLMGDGVLPNDVAASVWLEKAARRGDGLSQLALGMYLLRSWWDADAVKRGMDWIEKASASGCATASALLMRQDGISDEVRARREALWRDQVRKGKFSMMELTVLPYREVWLEDGARVSGQVPPAFWRALDAGDVTALALAGVWQVTGSMASAGVPQDVAAGVGRLAAASERGNAPATVALGSLCLDVEDGKDFGCDALGRGKIRGWVEKAAASGDGDSMALLGYWLLSGADGSGDAAGVKWLERAAQKDVPEAVGALALRMMMLDRREEAGRWFARLAGMTDRPDLLGVVALYYGKGIAPVAGENEVASEVRRLGWLGEKNAMQYLALMYDSGEHGSERFPQAARAVYAMMAEQGMDEAFLPLALVCAELGDGACARRWLARIDPDAVTSRDARELARMCVATGPDVCRKRLGWLASRAKSGDKVARVLFEQMPGLAGGR